MIFAEMKFSLNLQKNLLKKGFFMQLNNEKTQSG